MTLKTQFTTQVIHNQHVSFFGINSVACAATDLPVIESHFFAQHIGRIEVATVSDTDPVILDPDRMSEVLLKMAPAASPQKTYG